MAYLLPVSGDSQFQSCTKSLSADGVQFSCHGDESVDMGAKSSSQLLSLHVQQIHVHDNRSKLHPPMKTITVFKSLPIYYILHYI